MKNFKKLILILPFLLFSSCVSTKSTLKNVDSNAPIPKLSNNNNFVLSKISDDSRYGFDRDYPVNVFYISTINEELNCIRFLNALAGPKGEEVSFTKTGICCPFPSNNTSTGAGFLAVYEINYNGLISPKTIYINIYEKGILMAPIGFGIKK